MSDSLQPHGYSPWNSPGQNTGVGSLSLLQGIFPTQGLNPGLPHCRQILYQLSHKGSPRILQWVSLSLLQWIFQTQESNQDLLPCRRILYQLSYQGNVHQFARLTTLCERNFVTLGTALCRNYGFFFLSLYFLAVPLSMPGLSSPSRD